MSRTTTTTPKAATRQPQAPAQPPNGQAELARFTAAVDALAKHISSGGTQEFGAAERKLADEARQCFSELGFAVMRIISDPLVESTARAGFKTEPAGASLEQWIGMMKSTSKVEIAGRTFTQSALSSDAARTAIAGEAAMVKDAAVALVDKAREILSTSTTADQKAVEAFIVLQRDTVAGPLLEALLAAARYAQGQGEDFDDDTLTDATIADMKEGVRLHVRRLQEVFRKYLKVFSHTAPEPEASLVQSAMWRGGISSPAYSTRAFLSLAEKVDRLANGKSAA